MKAKHLWLFRICFALALFVAANRLFAFSDANTKAKYTLQVQEDDDELDVLLPGEVHVWDLDFTYFPLIHTLKAGIRINHSIQIPLFIRFQNLRL